ncbi:hypothetical protein M405DRAFT_561386 [Rhizopogon salebrosus TDB-379]|nr:hypothetical protein M405DRAFT_561386 [Rhizopogon salebrosus TDB-379]
MFKSALFYSPRVGVAGSISHSIAILCTIFRLGYRVWTGHFWWEDVWAALALIADVVCLACIWVNYKISSWVFAVVFTCVVWPARLSIIFFIVRLANRPAQRQIALLIAASFACMWCALLAQKLTICNIQSCKMNKPFALSQLITDVIADVVLVAAPLVLWRDIGLSRNRRILILSAFGASLLITAVTIPHNIMLMSFQGGTTIIFAHVKAALSLVICNLLVIVSFVYRVCRKEAVDLDQSFTSHGLFTTVLQLPSSTNPGTLAFGQDETTSGQIGTVQSKVTESKTENASILNAEEGISTEG